jgi:RNA polymerase sigma factor (sigma-70 family)
MQGASVAMQGKGGQPTSQMSEVIHNLRRTVLLRDGAGLTDGQLLEDYISRRENAALEVLVRRHGPMVWGVCCRVLRDYHEAEDAFQATFLVFVRKVASIASRELLANWLYKVAHQTALKARATAARRKGRERQVPVLPEPDVTEQELWRDLQPLLDQELSGLPEKYRIPIVLCDLQGKTRKEAARQLGCPEGTVAGRLARARVMLAKRLARHGLAVSGGVLGTALAQQMASASVPASVLASTIQGASLFATGQAATAGVVSAKVAALAEGVLKTMLLTKLKIATAVVLVVALACSGFGLLSWTLTAAEPRQEAPRAGRKDAPRKDAAREPARKESPVVGAWIEQREIGGDLLITFTPEGKLRFEDGQSTVEEGSYKVNDTKVPPEIDFITPARANPANGKPPLLGIYRIEKDALTLYLSESKRPTKYEAPEGSDIMRLTLHRVPKLAGKWQAVAVEVAGKAHALETARSNVWEIADGKITAKVADNKEGTKEEARSFKIDPTKKPAHIDIEGEAAGQKTVIKGIYKLEGDELTVCLIGANDGRPSEFSSSDLRNGEKGGNILMKFKREKEARPARPPEKKEPQVDGKKLSEWIQCLLSDDVVARQGAVLALGKIGPEAAPALAIALNDRQVVNCRLWAAHALGKMGATVKGSVPQLEAALRDESVLVRIEAARALWRIDGHKAAVPALIEALRDEDASTRYRAAEMLEGIGPEAKTAVPALIDALNDPGFAELNNPNSTERRPVSQMAARALKSIDPATAKKHGIE